MAKKEYEKYYIAISTGTYVTPALIAM